MTKFIVIEGDIGRPDAPAPSLETRATLMKRLGADLGPVLLMLIAPADLGGINRLYGLDTGDALIREVRRRAQERSPEGAVVTEFTGGKTAVAVHCETSAEAATLAKKLRIDASGDGPDVARNAVRIGAAWAPSAGPGGLPADMIVEAALSAYDKTIDGGISLIELDRTAEADEMAMARFALDAIKAGDARIALQPVVSADGSGRVLFREALLRIHTTDGAEVAAGRFMPALDRLGLTEEADIAALRLSFQELDRNPSLRISVNLSGASIRRTAWAAEFKSLAGLSPSCAERLIVEVTEEAALANASETAGLFAMIRASGAALAIDDFGAGRTSFSHLRDFRFDMVKIDGAFIRDIDCKPDNQMLVSALVAIGRQFDMMVIAERVETAMEARALRKLEIDGFQGFLFGRPALVWSEGARIAEGAG
ncbi:MAG: EAL domain-containing protein [Pseudomonadota bacterium]